METIDSSSKIGDQLDGGQSGARRDIGVALIDTARVLISDFATIGSFDHQDMTVSVTGEVRDHMCNRPVG